MRGLCPLSLTLSPPSPPHNNLTHTQIQAEICQASTADVLVGLAKGLKKSMGDSKVRKRGPQQVQSPCSEDLWAYCIKEKLRTLTGGNVDLSLQNGEVRMHLSETQLITFLDDDNYVERRGQIYVACGVSLVYKTNVMRPYVALEFYQGSGDAITFYDTGLVFVFSNFPSASRWIAS